MGELKAKIKQCEKYIIPISLSVLVLLYLICFMIPSVEKAFLIIILTSSLILFCILDFGDALIYLACFSGGGVAFLMNGVNIPFNAVLIALFVSVFCIKLLIQFIKREKKINWLSFSLCLLLAFYGLVGFDKAGIFVILENTVMIVLAYLTCYFVKEIDFKKLVLYYVICVLFFICLGLFLTLLNIGKDVLWLWDRYMSFYTNPNSLYAMCIMAMAFLMALYFKKQISKIWFWIFNVVLIIGGLLTMSKAFIICLGILVVLFFVFEFISNKQMALVELFVLGVAGLIFVLVFKDRLLSIFDRFTNSSSENILDSVLTGRAKIWEAYFKTWTSSSLTLIFGCGVSASQPIIFDANSVSQQVVLGAHSSYVQLLYQYGIVGNLLIIANIVLLFVLNKRKIKINWYASFAVFMFLFRSVVETFLGIKYIVLIILAFALFIECKQKENNSKEEVCGKSENESSDK